MLSTFVWLRHLSNTQSRSLGIFVTVERESERGEKRQDPFSLIPLRYPCPASYGRIPFVIIHAGRRSLGAPRQAAGDVPHA